MAFLSLTRHFAGMAAITGVIVFAMVYPYVPGRYDAMAVPLSTMAQLTGVLGLPLVVVGVAWLAFARWRRSRGNASEGGRADGAAALAALVVASVIASVLALIAFAQVGPVLAVLTLALWLCVGSRLLPMTRAPRELGTRTSPAAPWYLIIVPAVVLIAQLVFATPLTEASRNTAIASSAELIADHEAYRETNSRYPDSLEAVWSDYDAGVVGIDGYRYASREARYDLSFEQPRFLLDDIGTREFVVYDGLDDHVMVSHDSWILLLSPAQLASTQGWYAVHDASKPHWKVFWFD